jgi:hypothetical protein
VSVVAIMKGPANGGQGGKLGHSNMDHWVYTEEIKAASRKVRRLIARQEIAQERRQWEEDRPKMDGSLLFNSGAPRKSASEAE